MQSNTSRQVAAACAKLGLECHLAVMQGRVPGVEPEYEQTGNILLNRLYGAIIHEIPWNENRNMQLHLLADNLTVSGRRPFVVPYGASDALGAMGYVQMVLELLTQCEVLGISPSYVVHASGSGGTRAGITAALTALGRPLKCIGIDIDAQPERVASDVRRFGRAAAALLAAEDSWSDELVEIAAGFAGPAYGVPDSATFEAISLAVRLEGLVLDPCMQAKDCKALSG